MINIAYKIAQNNTSLPNGFITEWFETVNGEENGYLVISKAEFDVLLSQNHVKLQNHIDEQYTQDQLRNIELQALIDKQILADGYASARKAEEDANKNLFAQFLAWKAIQDGYGQ